MLLEFMSMLTKKIKLIWNAFKKLAFPLNLIEFLKKVGNGETLLSFKFKGSITTTQYLRGGDILTYLHV